MQLVIAAFIAFVAAAFYGFTGRMLYRRPVSAEFRWPALAFSTWWLGLAFTTFLGGVQLLVAYAGYRNLDFYLTLLLVNLLVICVALWGLVYYLIFLFTGKNWHFIPLTVFYVLYFGLLLYWVQWQQPDHVVVDAWAVRMGYQAEDTGSLFSIIVILLVVPQIIGAFAYLSFYPRVKDRSQRYRVLLISLSIIIWFSSALLVTVTHNQTSDAWQIASKLIGLGAAAATLMAYNPPAFIQRWLNVHPIGGEPARRSLPQGGQ